MKRRRGAEKDLIKVMGRLFLVIKAIFFSPLSVCLSFFAIPLILIDRKALRVFGGQRPNSEDERLPLFLSLQNCILNALCILSLSLSPPLSLHHMSMVRRSNRAEI